MNAFALLVKMKDIEKSIQLLEKQIESSLTILGVKESMRNFSDSKKGLMETDYKLINFLIKDPRRKAEDIAQAAGVTTKTVKRRLDKLVEAGIVSFSVILRPEALTVI